MLQDFHFKIVNHASYKHTNVNALSRIMDKYKANEDFGNEIQDLARITQDASKPSFHTSTVKLFSIYSLC
jgi:hypothetical protein